MSSLAVVYDLDGTIIDTQGVHASAWKHAAGHLGLPPIDDAFLAFQSGKTNEAAAEHLLGHSLYQAIGRNLVDLKQKHAEQHASAATIFPDFEPALVELGRRHIPVWVCTSSGQRFCQAVYERFPILLPLGGRTVWREMYQQGKPDPEGLLLACARMNVQPSECLYVGDASSDGEAARNAGCPFVFYDGKRSQSDQSPSELSWRFIRDHSEIMRCL